MFKRLFEQISMIQSFDPNETHEEDIAPNGRH